MSELHKWMVREIWLIDTWDQSLTEEFGHLSGRLITREYTFLDWLKNLQFPGIYGLVYKRCVNPIISLIITQHSISVNENRCSFPSFADYASTHWFTILIKSPITHCYQNSSMHTAMGTWYCFCKWHERKWIKCSWKSWLKYWFFQYRTMECTSDTILL